VPGIFWSLDREERFFTRVEDCFNPEFRLNGSIMKGPVRSRANSSDWWPVNKPIFKLRKVDCVPWRYCLRLFVKSSLFQISYVGRIWSGLCSLTRCSVPIYAGRLVRSISQSGLLSRSKSVEISEYFKGRFCNLVKQLRNFVFWSSGRSLLREAILGKCWN